MRICRLRASHGFTLVELMVALGMVGMLASLAVPLASSYLMKAEYASLTAPPSYLMDGQEACFIENDAFYPAGFGTITVNWGKQMDIPELAHTFPADHKHRYLPALFSGKAAPTNQLRSWDELVSRCPFATT